MRSQFSNGCLAFILLIIKRSQANPIRQFAPIEYQKPKEEKENGSLQWKELQAATKDYRQVVKICRTAWGFSSFQTNASS